MDRQETLRLARIWLPQFLRFVGELEVLARHAARGSAARTEIHRLRREVSFAIDDATDAIWPGWRFPDVDTWESKHYNEFGFVPYPFERRVLTLGGRIDNDNASGRPAPPSAGLPGGGG